MSRIACLDCIDGKHNHCDGCNLYKISNNMDYYLKSPIALSLASAEISHYETRNYCDRLCYRCEHYPNECCINPSAIKERLLLRAGETYDGI